ncbi:phosphodiesterase [Stutzerimonas kunmingensis]|uniref:phosphodiesterase n=1 Tax=Stutzerimonas kunmingensis TaxID=1211807 RepID=UPI00289EFA03|nr:phosphodiesterase [Stutzerimonas kunmingensis]
MQIISHRGYWKSKAERNTRIAFERSFDLGFGTELDVRDYQGGLVIAHDMATGDEMSLDELLLLMDGRQFPLAVNIKADGLVESVRASFEHHGHRNWFVFDMSVPDMRAYLAAGVRTFSRMSEVERQPAYLERCAGIWLDAFEGGWYDAALLEALLESKRLVCVVSDELHGRPSERQWALLSQFASYENLLLCTDFPEQATSCLMKS